MTFQPYIVNGKPLLCLICKHDKFAHHKGLKENRFAAYMGASWLMDGVDKMACEECGFTMTFGKAPNRPKTADPDPAKLYPGMAPEAREALGLPPFQE